MQSSDLHFLSLWSLWSLSSLSFYCEWLFLLGCGDCCCWLNCEHLLLLGFWYFFSLILVCWCLNKLIEAFSPVFALVDKYCPVVLFCSVVFASAGACCSPTWAVFLAGSPCWSSAWASSATDCGFLGSSTFIGCTPCNWHLPWQVAQIQVLQHIWHHVDEWVLFDETSSNTLTLYFSAGTGWNWHQDCVDSCNNEIIAVQWAQGRVEFNLANGQIQCR